MKDLDNNVSKDAKSLNKIMMIEMAGRGKLCHYTYSLGTVLSRFGGEVTLVTSKNYELEGLPRNFKLVKTFSDRLFFFPLFFLSLLIRINRERPQVIHFQWIASPLTGLFVIKVVKRVFSGVRIVYTPHNVLPHR